MAAVNMQYATPHVGRHVSMTPCPMPHYWVRCFIQVVLFKLFYFNWVRCHMASGLPMLIEPFSRIWHGFASSDIARWPPLSDPPSTTHSRNDATARARSSRRAYMSRISCLLLGYWPAAARQWLAESSRKELKCRRDDINMSAAQRATPEPGHRMRHFASTQTRFHAHSACSVCISGGACVPPAPHGRRAAVPAADGGGRRRCRGKRQSVVFSERRRRRCKRRRMLFAMCPCPAT